MSYGDDDAWRDEMRQRRSESRENLLGVDRVKKSMHVTDDDVELLERLTDITGESVPETVRMALRYFLENEG
jgi:uncharacterized membrane protein